MECIFCKENGNNNNAGNNCNFHADYFIGDMRCGDGIVGVDVRFVPVIWGNKCKTTKVYNRYSDRYLNIPFYCADCMADSRSSMVVTDVSAEVIDTSGGIYATYEIIVKGYCADCGKECVSKKRICAQFDKFVNKECDCVYKMIVLSSKFCPQCTILENNLPSIVGEVKEYTNVDIAIEKYRDEEISIALEKYGICASGVNTLPTMVLICNNDIRYAIVGMKPIDVMSKMIADFIAAHK